LRQNLASKFWKLQRVLTFMDNDRVCWKLL